MTDSERAGEAKGGGEPQDPSAGPVGQPSPEDVVRQADGHVGAPPDRPAAEKAPGEDAGPGTTGAAPVPSSTAHDESAVEEFRALNDPERRRQIERHGAFFVVEGLFALDVLLGSAYPVRTVLVADNKVDRVRELIGHRGRDLGAFPLLVRPADEVAEITGFAFHRGVLATADRLPLPAVADVVAPARLLLVIVGVNDHENLGALFRNAAAFGVDGVLLDSTTPDPLYRRSIRVSMGHVLRMPWTRLDLDVVDAFAELRASGFTVLALTPGPDAEPIDATTSGLATPTAVVVGAEGPGLNPAALAAADRRVRVPLAPGVDSLNVATAAAVALHRIAGLSG